MSSMSALSAFLFCVAICGVNTMATRTVVVTAGSSEQAKGAIRQLLQRPSTEPTIVRAVVRNAASPAALQLASETASVATAGGHSFHMVQVDADLSDLDATSRAFTGAQDVILITFSDFASDTEGTQVRTAARAAKEAGVRRIVFSSGDRLDGLPALSAKWYLERVLSEVGGVPCVALRSSFFFENFVRKNGQRRVTVSNATAGSASLNAHGEMAGTVGNPVYEFGLPLAATNAIPMIATADIGRAAALALSAWPEAASAPGAPDTSGLLGKTRDAGTTDTGCFAIPLAGDIVSPTQYVAAFEAASGCTGVYVEGSVQSLREKGAAGSAMFAAIADMYDWYSKGHPGHTRDPVTSRAQFPVIRTLQEWMATEGVEMITAPDV